jgi:serine/threonine protein kinase
MPRGGFGEVRLATYRGNSDRPYAIKIMSKRRIIAMKQVWTLRLVVHHSSNTAISSTSTLPRRNPHSWVQVEATIAETQILKMVNYPLIIKYFTSLQVKKHSHFVSLV